MIIRDHVAFFYIQLGLKNTRATRLHGKKQQSINPGWWKKSIKKSRHPQVMPQGDVISFSAVVASLNQAGGHPVGSTGQKFPFFRLSQLLLKTKVVCK